MGRSGRIDPEQLHAVHWRERLSAEGFDAIDAFLVEFPEADPRELKRLIQKARAMRHRHGTPRFLVAYIRGLEAAKRAKADITDDQARVPPTVS
ncbi:MAG: DUF615 domain-containing protein [Pseudomonadota bacterium]